MRSGPPTWRQHDPAAHRPSRRFPKPSATLHWTDQRRTTPPAHRGGISASTSSRLLNPDLIARGEHPHTESEAPKWIARGTGTLPPAAAHPNPPRVEMRRRRRERWGGSSRVEREGPLNDVDSVAVLGAQASVAAPAHRLVDLHPPRPPPPARLKRLRSGGRRDSTALPSEEEGGVEGGSS